MSISCIAIDDDPQSLESLAAYMEKLPELNLIQTFTEPLQALAEISVANPVDIIFMDVEMPTISGIELAGLLRQKTKHLIFTTAHPKYALDAFKVDADGYLLKPYSIFNFAKTINNLYPAGYPNQKDFTNPEEQFFYYPAPNEPSQLSRINLNELIAVEDHQENISIITNQEPLFGAKINFAKMIKILQNHPAFIQISPSIIIAKQHIKSVLGNQILLSSKVSYTIEESHLELFSNFVQSNNHKDQV